MQNNLIEKIQSFFQTKPILIAYIIVAIVFLLTAGIYFFENNLMGWSSYGFLESAQGVSNHWPNFTFWDSQYFNGFAQNYFYPPLFTWIVGTIGLAIPIEISFKLITIIIYFAIVPVLYFFCRTFWEKKDALLTTLFFTAMFFLPDWIYFGEQIGLGSTAWSLMFVGLVPASLGTLFALIFISLSERKANTLLLAVIFGVGVLTHYVFLTTIIYLLIKLITSKENNFKKNIFILAAGLLLSAFFWIPAISALRFTHSYAQQLPLLNLTTAIVVLAIAAMIFRRKNLTQKQIGLFGIVIFLIIIIASFIGIKGQFDRAYFLIIILCAAFIFQNSKKILHKIKNRFDSNPNILENASKALPIIIAIVILLLSLTIDFTTITKVNYAANFEKNDYTHIVMASNEDNATQRALFYELAKNPDMRILKGFYSEQSANINYTTQMQLFIDPNDFYWGAAGLGNSGLDPLNFQYLVHLFGVASIISTATVPTYTGYDATRVIGEQQIKSKQTNLLWFNTDQKFETKKITEYRLAASPMAEIIYNEPVVIENANEEALAQKILQVGTDFDYFTVVTQTKLSGYTLNNSAKINSYERESGKIKFTVDSNTPVIVLVKESYFPNWRAYQDGAEIKIYEAAPHLMLVIGKGNIELRYERTLIENISLAISALALIAIIVTAVLKRKISPKN